MKNLKLDKSKFAKIARRALPLFFALSMLKPASETIIKDVSNLSSGKKGENVFVFQSSLGQVSSPSIDYHKPQSNTTYISDEVKNLKIQKVLDKSEQSGFNLSAPLEASLFDLKTQTVLFTILGLYALSFPRKRISKSTSDAFKEGKYTGISFESGLDDYLKKSSFDLKAGGFGKELTAQLKANGISEADFLKALKQNFLLDEAKDIKAGSNPAPEKINEIANNKLKTNGDFGPFFWKKFDLAIRRELRTGKGKGINRPVYQFRPSLQNDFIAEKYNAALLKTCERLGLKLDPRIFSIQKEINSEASKFNKNVVKKYLTTYVKELGVDLFYRFLNPKGYVSPTLYPEAVNSAILKSGFWENMKEGDITKSGKLSKGIEASKIDRIIAGESWQTVIGINDKGQINDGFWKNMRQLEEVPGKFSNGVTFGKGKIDRILAGEAPESVLTKDELWLVEQQKRVAMDELKLIKAKTFYGTDLLLQKLKYKDLSAAFETHAKKLGVTKADYLKLYGLDDATIKKALVIGENGKYNIGAIPVEVQKQISEKNVSWWGRNKVGKTIGGDAKYAFLIAAGFAVLNFVPGIYDFENKEIPWNHDFFNEKKKEKNTGATGGKTWDPNPDIPEGKIPGPTPGSIQKLKNKAPWNGQVGDSVIRKK